MQRAICRMRLRDRVHDQCCGCEGESWTHAYRERLAGATGHSMAKEFAAPEPRSRVSSSEHIDLLLGEVKALDAEIRKRSDRSRAHRTRGVSSFSKQSITLPMM